MLTEQFYNCLERIVNKITLIFSSSGGWWAALLMSAISFLGPEKNAFIGLMLAVALDMVWGVAVSIKEGKFILSYLLRETILKILIYISVLFVALFIERSLDESLGIATRIICALAALCELWSACANILIICPRMPFIRVLKKYLSGEIASKINMSKDDVENVMNKKDEQKTTS